MSIRSMVTWYPSTFIQAKQILAATSQSIYIISQGWRTAHLRPAATIAYQHAAGRRCPRNIIPSSILKYIVTLIDIKLPKQPIYKNEH